jgi:hypothetical protein
MSVLDVTGIDKSAYERVGGVRSGSMGFTSLFNPAAAAAHPTLSALPTTDVAVTYARGTALGNAAACLIGKQIDYNPTRANDGGLTFEVSAESNGFGLEWGEQHTAGKRTDTVATNGTGVDGVAASAFGLQAYLQVFSFTGTSCTIKLQESSDNGAGDAFADVVGGGFTAVTTAPGTQRIATSAALAVERYLRIVTTGTFSNCVFSVVVVRNRVAVTF